VGVFLRDRREEEGRCPNLTSWGSRYKEKAIGRGRPGEGFSFSGLTTTKGSEDEIHHERELQRFRQRRWTSKSERVFWGRKKGGTNDLEQTEHAKFAGMTEDNSNAPSLRPKREKLSGAQDPLL